MSVGEYAAARARGDRRARQRARTRPSSRRHRALPARGARRPRDPAAAGARRARADAEREYDARSGRRSRAARPTRSARRRRRSTRTTGAASCARSSSPRSGQSLIPTERPPLGRSDATPDARSSASTSRRTSWSGGSCARTDAMFAARRRRGGARRRSQARALAHRRTGARARRARAPPAERGARADHRSAPAATPPTSASGCGGSRHRSRRCRPAARRRWRMRFSTWHALGNTLPASSSPAPEPLDAGPRISGSARARPDRRPRGPVEVHRTTAHASSIWNPDGSTRRAVRATAPASPRAGSRRSPGATRSTIERRRATVRRAHARRRRDRAGARRGRPSARRRLVGRHRVRRRSRSATRTRSCSATRARRSAATRPALETHPRFPGPHERPARPRRRRRRGHGARLGARGGGDAVVRHRARSPSPPSPSQRGWCDSPVTVHSSRRRSSRRGSSGGRAIAVRAPAERIASGRLSLQEREPRRCRQIAISNSRRTSLSDVFRSVDALRSADDQRARQARTSRPGTPSGASREARPPAAARRRGARPAPRR